MMSPLLIFDWTNNNSVGPCRSGEEGHQRPRARPYESSAGLCKKQHLLEKELKILEYRNEILIFTMRNR